MTLRDVSHVHLLARKLAVEFALIAECVEMPGASRVVVSIHTPRRVDSVEVETIYTTKVGKVLRPPNAPATFFVRSRKWSVFGH